MFEIAGMQNEVSKESQNGNHITDVPADNENKVPQVNGSEKKHDHIEEEKPEAENKKHKKRFVPLYKNFLL